MIIFDYTGIAYASIFAPIGIPEEDIDERIVRHMILNTLRMYVDMLAKDYGGPVYIAADSNSWRKEIFPHYKAARKKKREDRKIDWKMAHETMDTVFEEIDDILPYHTLRVPRAEADDIIGVLVRDHSKSDNDGRIVIVSSDKDFVQLQKYEKVDQYSPNRKTYIREDHPNEALFEHVVRGDTSDGVPNILSDEDTLVTEGKRQKPMAAKKLAEWTSDYEGFQQNILGENPELAKRFKTNYQLIALSETPRDLVEEIRNAIAASTDKTAPTKKDFYQYLIDNRCSELIESIDDFYKTKTMISLV